MIFPRFLSLWSEESLKTLNLIIDDIARYVNMLLWGKGLGRRDITIQDTGPQDTVFEVEHNLGSVPSGYLVYYQNKPGSLYVVDWDSKKARMKFSGSYATVKVRFFA